MAAKQVITTGSILIETVAQGLNIQRYVRSDNLQVQYNVTLPYCDYQFLLDDAGNKIQVVNQNTNQKNIYFTPEKVGLFMLNPITVAGVDTTLGEYLANLMDAEILEDLNKPAPAAPVVP
jgi:hypothetical protein